MEEKLCYSCEFELTPYQPCLDCVKRRHCALCLFNLNNFLEFVRNKQPIISMFYQDQPDRVMFAFGEPQMEFSETTEVCELMDLRNILHRVKLVKIMEIEDNRVKFKTPLKW